MSLPFGTTIEVRLGDPIERKARDWEQLVHTTEGWIRDTLESWRAPQPATA